MWTFTTFVLDGALRHAGDPVLDKHLRWCAADRSDAGELRRVSKADRTRPIDAVVAVALAYWRVSLDAGERGEYVWDTSALYAEHLPESAHLG